MLKASAIVLLMGGLLVAAPAVYSGEQGSMSDMQHRKTMGGSMHHPEKADDAVKSDAAKEPANMSDMQHRKTMGGSMHHPERAAGASKDDAEKTPASMSDMQHRKMMGGSMHHPDKE